MTANQRLYTLHSVIEETRFRGDFELGRNRYQFIYKPSQAALSNNRFTLSGDFIVNPGRGERVLKGVKATLSGVQTDITGSYVKRALLRGTVQTGNISTSEQKQQQASTVNENQVQPERVPNLPITESTDEYSLVGVMYFTIDQFDARAAGIPFNGRLQLNTRIVSTSSQSRALKILFTDVAASLLSGKIDNSLAEASVKEINRIIQV
jgi:hypothetical protein